MWAQKEEKEFWLQWLDRYKALQCLWDEDAKRHASRSTRNEAYEELAELAKCVNPNADVSFVRSRINAFRTCYRREFKKVEAAKANGITYTPQLFYYDKIKFVNPDETDLFDETKYLNESETENDPISSQSPNDTANKAIVKNEEMKKVLNDYLSTNFESKVIENKTKTKPTSVNNNRTGKTSTKENQKAALKRRYAPTEATDSLDYDDFDEQSNHPNQSLGNVTIKPSEREHDEYDILGKRIAEHFRNMTPNQRLLAEKIITDVCIYGRMEKLTLDSTLALSEEQEVSGPQPDGVDYDNPETFIYTA